MSRVPQRNVYVREDDAELWEWAQQYARTHRWTTSAVVMMALEKFRAEVAEKRGDRSD